MDKNFFMFDLEDELAKVENKSLQEKTQIISKTSENNSQNDAFIDFYISNKAKQVKNKGFEKNIGLPEQRVIKSNISQVDDLVNFDFKSKDKIIAAAKEAEAAYEAEQNLAKLKLQMESDEEVADVIEKAHIGVIFY